MDEVYPSSSAVSAGGMDDASVSSKLISKLAGIMRITGLVTSCKPSNGVIYIYIYNHEGVAFNVYLINPYIL